MRERTYSVKRDEVGFYAALQDADNKVVWRSLSTSDPVRAATWCIQASCHGVSAHTKPCPDCTVKSKDGGKPKPRKADVLALLDRKIGPTDEWGRRDDDVFENDDDGDW